VTGDPLVRRRTVVVVALVVAAAVAVPVGWGRLRAGVERQDGLRLAAAGRIDDAEPLLRAALARDPGDVEVLSAMTSGKLDAGAVAEAEGYLSRWCELRPRDPHPFRMRLEMRQRLARLERVAAERLRLSGLAVADAQHVLELAPNDDVVHRELAELLLRVGRPAEAEQASRVCLVRTPGDPWLLYLLAKSCHAQGNRADAEAALDPVVRDRTFFFAEALLLRAVLHREAGRPERAVPLLRQALTLDHCPRQECLYHLGLALADTGQYDEAKRVLAEIQALALQNAVAHDHFPNTEALRAHLAEALRAANKE
jgi:tetratricopeptide (TPR) repeat protein